MQQAGIANSAYMCCKVVKLMYRILFVVTISINTVLKLVHSHVII